jgi:hypothetical protein
MERRQEEEAETTYPHPPKPDISRPPARLGRDIKACIINDIEGIIAPHYIIQVVNKGLQKAGL